MRSVMISIRPEWCAKIASGEKTIEVRKTRPKIDTPFKCYIYQTQPKISALQFVHDGDDIYGETYHGPAFPVGPYKGINAGSRLFGKWGKVIGEFVCDWIYEDFRGDYADLFEKHGCLTLGAQKAYGGNKPLYGWHISDLVIYDEPRELTDFRKPELPLGLRYEDDIIERPPQSWMYVENATVEEGT